MGSAGSEHFAPERDVSSALLYEESTTSGCLLHVGTS